MWCNIAASHRGRLYMGTRGHVCNIMCLDSCLELFVPPNVIYEQTIIKNTGWSNETEINGCVFIIIAGRKDEGLRNKNSLSNGNNIWVMDYVLKNCKSGQILIFSEVRRPPGYGDVNQPRLYSGSLGRDLFLFAQALVETVEDVKCLGPDQVLHLSLKLQHLILKLHHLSLHLPHTSPRHLPVLGCNRQLQFSLLV